VTLSIVGVGFLLFSLAVRYLNVFESQVSGAGSQVSTIDYQLVGSGTPRNS